MAIGRGRLTTLIVVLIFLVLFLVLLDAGFSEWVTFSPAFASLVNLTSVPTFSLYWILSNLSNSTYPLGTAAISFLVAAVFYFIALVVSVSLLKSRRLLIAGAILCIISAAIGFVSIGFITNNTNNSLIAGNGQYLVLTVGIIYSIIYGLSWAGISLDNLISRLLEFAGIKK